MNFTILSIVPVLNSRINDILGIIFTVGLIIIYVPQLLKIYQAKSSKGISIMYVFMGHSASILTTINSIIFYINGWKICSGFLNCGENFIGYGLIISQWIMFFIMYIMFNIYLCCPNDIIYFNITRLNFNRIMYALSFSMGIIAAIITFCLLSKYDYHYDHNASNNSLTIWSSILEIIILIFFLIHYIPQIYECWRVKSAGAISLITLGIMCPGTLAWTVYLALQGDFFTNNKDSSSPMVWISYLVVGIMQSILLFMGIYYEKKKKNMMRLNEETQALFDSENVDYIENSPIRHKLRSNRIRSDVSII